MFKITYSTELNQTKFKKVDLGNSILKYDVIQDALKVICDKNIKSPREFGDMGTGKILAKNRKIAYFVSAIWSR